MRRRTKTWWIAIGAPVAVLLACAVEDVRASSYDQSCTKSDDCMVVFEIAANGGECKQPCGAINKHAEAPYNADVDKELHDCSSIEKGECHGNAVCHDGTCTFEATAVKDAGTD